MIVETKYGEFDCKDITRTKRREIYKRVKEVFQSADIGGLHELGDEFALLAFGDKADDILKGLSAVEEDEILLQIISDYMGLDLKNATGE
jgi:hypothetical protein|tara:strand:+ start:471 stop:740 length:270 start_codon:yes stop_codon:yes gene_type:complete